jgi:hypothetical protein
MIIISLGIRPAFTPAAPIYDKPVKLIQAAKIISLALRAFQHAPPMGRVCALVFGPDEQHEHRSPLLRRP